MVLTESETIQLGSELSNFDLANVDGTRFSNKDLETGIVLFAFICNHCPYVHKIINDFVALAKQAEGKIQFVAISSNDPNYNPEDSFDNMKKFAKDHNFNFPYLYDESQKVAKAFGAVCTPDIFVYKRPEDSRPYKLAYHGRTEDLDTALGELLLKNEVSFVQYPSIGCSIKWYE